MRRAVVPVIFALLVGAAWWAVPTVGGQADPDEPVLAKPRNTAPPSEPAALPKSPAAKKPSAAPSEVPAPKAPAPVGKEPPVAPPAEKQPAPGPGTLAPPPLKAPGPGGEAAEIIPPDQLPDVVIPPIPEVSKEPFAPGPRPVRPKPPDAIDEGKRLFNREGRLEVDPIGRSIFVFDSGDKPMWLIESTWREYLEKVTVQGKKKAHWRVSGIVTVYGGRNYLLLTKVVPMAGEEERL